MDKFNFYVPIDDSIFEKSGTTNDKVDYKNMYLQGVASTSDTDVDGEILEPSGFNLDLFKSMGLVNYDHLSKKSPKAFIGEPVEAGIKDNKFFVKAKLWEKSPIARDLWDTLDVMKKSNSSRKLAWSIEGVPLQRNPQNPKHITKSIITNVAVTFMPKNGNTFAEICKGVQKEDFTEPEYEETQEDYFFKGIYGDHEYTINKDFTITKAMVAGSETGQQLVGKETTGAALKVESLDDDLKILTIPIETVNWAADNWDSFTKDTKKAIQKAFHVTIEKGKKANIGEIREWSGKRYKKQPNGKWVEVSEHGMTKKEHDDRSEKMKKYAKESPNGHDMIVKLDSSKMHSEMSSKLSDKEYTDEEVGLKKQPEENKKVSSDELIGKTVSIGKNGIKYKVENIGKDGYATLEAQPNQDLGNSSKIQVVKVSLLRDYATISKEEVSN